jgi:D-3-phosphoglycerate dehydrogenase / 2-oxoglutarate reductase
VAAAGPKVHIFQSVDESGESHARLRKAGVDLKVAEKPWMQVANMREPIELELDADTVAAAGVASRLVQVPRRTLEQAKELRLIAYYTVGYDSVDMDAATRLGILVVHSPTETNWGGVAEGTVANILAVLKKVREKDRHVKAGGWREPSLQGQYLGARHIDNFPGLTLGFIGLGRIGSRVADLFGPWRARMIGCDPYIDESVFVHHNVKRVSLETVLGESDVVTVHCNLTPETRGMIGAAQLARMKKTAVLCNHARGAIVDTAALTEALANERIAAAVLDVLAEEPPAADTPLLALGDKVLLSPHMVSNNVGCDLGIAAPWVEKALMDALQGVVPKHVVNPAALARWLERFGGKALI